MPAGPGADRRRGAARLALLLVIGAAPPPLAAEAGPGADAGYSVVPRAGELSFQPCASCHEHLPANATPRELFAPHPVRLEHGDGRIWCLNCHHAENRDVLADALGGPVPFDAAPRVCATCHAGHYADWEGGAHGKRVGDWRGERRLFGCTHCHDPHAPALAPRAPAPPPERPFGAAATEHQE